jgi:hypothetical protein
MTANFQLPKKEKISGRVPQESWRQDELTGGKSQVTLTLSCG